MTEIYTPEFQAVIADGSKLSAQRLMPHALKLVGPVASVVDVGCGSGSWMRAANAGRMVGIDGPWSRDLFEASGPGTFVAADLTQPLGVDDRFDLAISMEVAEHLPEDAADTFVASLASLSDVVLFSAAVPGQGGVNHINEKWPEYWWQKFLLHGYECIDVLREQVWRDRQIEWWYRQNVLIFATSERAHGMGAPTKPKKRRLL